MCTENKYRTPSTLKVPIDTRDSTTHPRRLDFDRETKTPTFHGDPRDGDEPTRSKNRLGKLDKEVLVYIPLERYRRRDVYNHPLSDYVVYRVTPHRPHASGPPVV